MDDVEARMRCLELSAQLTRASGEYSPQAVVNIATVLYDFTQPPRVEEIPDVSADKPKTGRPRKFPIL